MRHVRERGRGRKEKSAYHMNDPEYESLQGVRSCCAKTHRRAYHMTPDRRWHGQQLPYSYTYSQSTLLRRRNFTAKTLGDYSTAVSVSLRISTTYVLIAVVVVSRRYIQQKHVPSYNVPGSINNYQVFFSVRGRNLAKTINQLPWISNFIVSY